MTVSNTTARTSAVGTNVAGQEIAFSFPINATSDLTVKSRVTTTGVESTLTETTDYTVSINGDSGGTVTLVAAWATTYTLWVIRTTPRTQTLDLEQGDDLKEFIATSLVGFHNVRWYGRLSNRMFLKYNKG